MKCILCKNEPATTGWSDKDCCADCFWERDAEEKRIKRSNPIRQYNAAFTSSITLFNKTEEEAHQIARAIVKNRKLE